MNSCWMVDPADALSLRKLRNQVTGAVKKVRVAKSPPQNGRRLPR